MVTTDHAVIKEWILRHKGTPEIIDDPEAGADKLGIRITFPGNVNDRYFIADSLHHRTTWEEFFAIFEDQGLALEYSEHLSVVDPSLSYRFMKREYLSPDELLYL